MAASARIPGAGVTTLQLLLALALCVLVLVAVWRMRW